MTREQLLIEITALADAAMQSGERDTALILSTLACAIGEQSEDKLAAWVALFRPPRPEAAKAKTA